MLGKIQVYEFHSCFEHKCPPFEKKGVLKKCCKNFHVSLSSSIAISFCNNLKKRQIQTNEKKIFSSTLLTPYIFLVNICFRTEKKSYPQKRIISLCEIKTTEKKY